MKRCQACGERFDESESDSSELCGECCRIQSKLKNKKTKPVRVIHRMVSPYNKSTNLEVVEWRKNGK